MVAKGDAWEFRRISHFASVTSFLCATEVHTLHRVGHVVQQAALYIYLYISPYITPDTH